MDECVLDNVANYRCDLCGFLSSSECAMQQHRHRHSDSCPKSIDLNNMITKFIDTNFRTDKSKSRCSKSIAMNNLHLWLKFDSRRPKNSDTILDNLIRDLSNENVNSHKQIVVPAKRKKYKHKRKTLMYNCHVCHKKFSKPSLLKRHIPRHTNEKLFECLICRTRFTQKASAKSHLLLHFKQSNNPTGTHDQRRINEIVNGFMDAKDTRTYNLNHSLSNTLECVANMNLDDPLSFKSHTPEEGSNDGTTNSHIQNSSILAGNFSYDDKSENPVPTGVEPIVVSGSDVPLRFSFDFNFKTVTEHNQSYNCSTTCSASVVKSENFLLHPQNHLMPELQTLNNSVNSSSVDNNIVFKCHKCARRFSTRQNLRSHVNKLHQSILSFKVCSLCNLTFGTLNEFKMHQRVHVSERLFSCYVCHKRFKYLRACRKHMRSHSRIESEFNSVTGTKNAPRVLTFFNQSESHLDPSVDLDNELTVLPNTEFLTDLHVQRDTVADKVTVSTLQMSDLKYRQKAMDCGVDTNLIDYSHVDTNDQTIDLTPVSHSVYLTSDNILQQMIETDTSFDCNNKACGTVCEYANMMQSAVTVSRSHVTDSIDEKPSQSTDTLNDAVNKSGTVMTVNLTQSTSSSRSECEAFNFPLESVRLIPSVCSLHTESVAKLINYYACGLCEQQFSNPTDLLSHSQFAHANPIKPYKCTDCVRTFSNPILLYRHWSELHDSKRTTKPVSSCPLCPTMVFGTKSALTRHIICCHPAPNSEPFRCGQCGKLFVMLRNLELHVKSNLEGVRICSPTQKTCETKKRSRVQVSDYAITALHPNLIDEIAKLRPSDKLSLSERYLIEAASEHVQNIVTLPRDVTTNFNNHNFPTTVDINSYRCDKCYRRFCTYSEFKRHKLKFHRLNKATPICAKSSLNAINHPGLICHLCGRGFASRTSLRLHIRLHTDTRRYMCPNCNALFHNPISRKRHLLNKCPALTTKPSHGSYLAKCKTSDSEDYSFIRDSTKSPKYNSYTCDIDIDPDNVNQSDRLTGLKNCNCPNNTADCTQCTLHVDIVLSAATAIAALTDSSHKALDNTHSSSNSPPVDDSSMNATTTNEANENDRLENAHFKSINEIESAENCLSTNCVTDFQPNYESAYMKSSNRLEHSPNDCEYLLKCSKCEKVFTRHSSLLRHERIHNLERSYKCSYCGKGFTQSFSLTSHELIHTNEKPYQCIFCEMRFRQSCNLKRHVKLVHSKHNVL